VEPDDREHLLDRLGRVDDFEAPAEPVQFLAEPHEQADAERAEVGDPRQVEPKPVGAAADQFVEVAGQVVGPVGVQPAAQLDLGLVPFVAPSEDFHAAYLIACAVLRTND
jgi:hypothetical protein